MASQSINQRYRYVPSHVCLNGTHEIPIACDPDGYCPQCYTRQLVCELVPDTEPPAHAKTALPPA